MKKLVFLLLMSVNFLLSNSLLAQDIRLNTLTNAQTFTQCSGYLYDDSGPTGNYNCNYDYWLTLCSPSVSSSLPQRMSLFFEEFNLDTSDTLWVYEGSSILGNPLTAGNLIGAHTGVELEGKTLITRLSDVTGCATVRFKSNSANVSSGWKAKIECVNRCQFSVTALDTFFIKYDTAGNMTTRPVRDGIDSIWNESHDNVTIIKFKSVDFCKDDSIILIAKPNFPENNTFYHQSLESCIYEWDFGDGNTDSVAFNTNVGHRWKDVSGYNLNLSVIDTNNGGCASRNVIDTRVRIAVNPIKTVSPIPDMCSGETFLLNVGYEGNNSVTIDSIDFPKGAKERFDSTIFIPDGPNCPPGYFEAPVTFNQFNPGAKIQNVNDIKSICVNVEHSFLGDLSIEVICPTGNSVWLKYFTFQGGSNLGIPNGDGGNACDPNTNPQGTGWTYCFSNQYLNNAQGVISGNMASPLPATNTIDTTGYYQTPPQSGQTWGASGQCDITGGSPCEVVDLNGFAPLIGCPLNGEWKLRLTDTWAIDNGYVFWWDLELGQSLAANWEYQVPLDTVVWDGPFMHSQTSNSSLITPPIDSCNNYKYNIHIVDDFGCVWDTATSLNVVCTPVVNLGLDTAICEQMNVVLDAGNPEATGYIWEPTGETTQTILAKTLPNSNSKITYVAQVTNFNGSIYCFGSDSINLIVYPSALASFSMDKNPLEGCEPLSFQLFSSSTNAAQYDWTVGQLKSNQPNPSFTFPYGTYDLKLKVTSDEGCTDSISQEGIINVYKSPIADFGWNPTNPTVSNPTINFINLTTPVDYSNQYHWKIQSNKLNDLRENIFGFEPTYTWVPIPGANTVGNYNITLDAYSVNNAPSGRLYECHDTVSKIITIINDSIMFPNVLTPNGDGVNDVLIIKNLVDGQAYPDNELSIFNRNGKRIFFKQDIRANQEIWDPAKTNTPTGTYFYKFIGRGPIRNIEYNGTIEILR